jgi:hypothetical protein
MSFQQTPTQICLCVFIINLNIVMFCISLVPLTPFFTQGLNFMHHGFAVHRIFQEHDLNKQQGFAVVSSENLC